MKKLLVFFLGLSFSILASSDDWIIGGLYSIPNENNTYLIVKIIKMDSIGVHLSLYSNIFHNRPEHIEESNLVILSDDNAKGLPEGVLHVAISHSGFKQWGACFIKKTTVNETERQAFENWFESKGGYY